MCPVNSWMNAPSAGLYGETELYQDLVDDNIAAGGVDVTYLPKSQINLDALFGESTMAEYKKGFVIEMLISNIVNFNGDGDVFSKFGLSSSDQATLLVSVRRFSVESQSYGLKQPVEGDLIFMPLSNSLWTIRKVKYDEDYYQFGRNYTFRLEVKLHDPSHETFEADSVVAPEEIGQHVPEVDMDSLLATMGLAVNSPQDESEAFTKAGNDAILTRFDVNDPFGGN